MNYIITIIPHWSGYTGERPTEICLFGERIGFFKQNQDNKKSFSILLDDVDILSKYMTLHSLLNCVIWDMNNDCESLKNVLTNNFNSKRKLKVIKIDIQFFSDQTVIIIDNYYPSGFINYEKIFGLKHSSEVITPF